MLSPADPSQASRLPRSIWVLGFVSLLMDVSSEIIHSLLPIYLVSVLGASALAVGLIEGAANATAPMIKVFSGALSDYLGKRKGLAILGYGLSALSKPVFALASGLGWIVTARIVDRVGKGIRGAPRDALIADLAPPDLRGAAYGLRQSLDVAGAVAGPLLAIALMLLWQNDFQAVFWAAVIPAVLTVELLVFGVREPARTAPGQRTNPIQRANLKRLNRAFWSIVAIGALFTLARFSEAFILLRAEALNLAPAWLPLVVVALNLAFSLSAYPFGKLSDRVPAHSLLIIGLVPLILADALLATANHWAWTLAAALAWGLHMGITQGLFAKLVADTAPEALRGTAFGVFNLVTGVTLFLANALAGLLWAWGGAALTFQAGAAVGVVVMVLLWVRRGRD
ncbi:MAG: MFS transporter [Pseudomonadota bacterium]|nr:MFS transporter [Pseudomonadota bacterium]